MRKDYYFKVEIRKNKTIYVNAYGKTMEECFRRVCLCNFVSRLEGREEWQMLSREGRMQYLLSKYADRVEISTKELWEEYIVTENLA